MNIERPPRDSFVLTAFLFELGLGVAAIGGGLWLGFDPLRSISNRWSAWFDNAQAVWWGVLAAAPLLAAMLSCERLPFAPLKRLRALVDQQLVPLFAPLSIFELAAISLAAGFGEEVLFRGFIQSGLATWIGPPSGTMGGLLWAAILFGACHWLTPTYALLATVVGIYLGLLYLWTDNLLAPLVAHAVYDFLALVYLTRRHPPR